MPVFNAEKFVVEAIESILNQTFQDFELLIIDDASTDASGEKIQSCSADPKVRLFKNEVNKGKNDSVNSLLDKCNGYYLSIHDADDFSAPNRFEIQIDYLNRNPDVVMIGTSFIEISDHKEKEVFMPTSYKEIRNRLPETSQFHGPTLVFKKEILEFVAGLYRYFTWGEDIDFTARVVEKFKATNLTDLLYYYRIHDKSLTKDLEVLSPERFINPKLRLFLANQRRSNGYDCLMIGKFEELEEEKKKLLIPFTQDPSLMYIMYCHTMLCFNLKRNALKAAARAVSLRFSYRNVKNLFSILVK